jgi:DNA-binding NtrC family response regulator
MDSIPQQITHRVLLVDNDEAVRAMMTRALELKGFEVVAAATLTEALRHIVTESFDVLITDLHVPNPTDGLAVVTAMRHSQPEAVTMLVSGFPDVQRAMAAVFLRGERNYRKTLRDLAAYRTGSRKDDQSQTYDAVG